MVALDFFVNDFLSGFRYLDLANLGVVVVLNALAQFVILFCVDLAHMWDVAHPHLASTWQQIVQNAELYAPVKIILVKAEAKRPFQHVRRNLADRVFVTIAAIHHRLRLLGINGRLKGRDVRPQDGKAPTFIIYRRTATTTRPVLVLEPPNDDVASLPPRLQLALRQIDFLNPFGNKVDAVLIFRFVGKHSPSQAFRGTYRARVRLSIERSCAFITRMHRLVS